MKTIITLLLIFITLQTKPADAVVVLSDMTFSKGETDTMDISFNASGSGDVWFQIRKEVDEGGGRLTCGFDLGDIEDPTKFKLTWVPYEENHQIYRSMALPGVVGNDIFMLNPYDFSNYPTDWYFALSPAYDDWSNALSGQLLDIHSPVSSTVPEPSTMILFSVGLLGIIRRKM